MTDLSSACRFAVALGLLALVFGRANVGASDGDGDIPVRWNGSWALGRRLDAR
ncbi:MAG TPA: hypothetical protein QGF35_05745 [Dehalococcoidia bacterium]|nr:hypothetical protein [Dehalococcoidia bacterium]